MAELQSWEGSLTKWYEENLDLRGGYSRKIHRAYPSSIANSEYVQEIANGLRIVARSGDKLSSPILIEAHYNHPYGNPSSITSARKNLIKKEYQKERKRFLGG